VYGYKLRYGYVPGTDTGTYPVPVLSLKWSTRASYTAFKGSYFSQKKYTVQYTK
jgi:hypothetical protein